MQCSCDLLTGIVSSWNALQTLLRRQSFSGSGLIYSGSLASWLRSIKYFDNDLLTLIVTHEVNYMMSGYCILIIAVERYILVCHPFRANQLLSKQNRWKFSTVLTLFVLLCIIRETLCLRSLQYCLFFLSQGCRSVKHSSNNWIKTNNDTNHNIKMFEAVISWTKSFLHLPLQKHAA